MTDDAFDSASAVGGSFRIPQSNLGGSFRIPQSNLGGSFRIPHSAFRNRKIPDSRNQASFASEFIHLQLIKGMQASQGLKHLQFVDLIPPDGLRAKFAIQFPLDMLFLKHERAGPDCDFIVAKDRYRIPITKWLQPRDLLPHSEI